MPIIGDERHVGSTTRANKEEGRGRRARRSIAGFLVLVVRENSVVRLARTTGKESRGRQSSAGGSHQKGARLVASGVEREEERERGEKAERGMKGGKERKWYRDT